MLVDITNPITNWMFPPRCVVCNRDNTLYAICASCVSTTTRASKTTTMLAHKKPAIFFYEGVIKSLIIAAKFHHSLLHAAVLIDLVQRELCDTILHSEIATYAPDAISFIPTHWIRRIERGVDMPQLFAMTLARMFAIPVVPMLSRKGYSYRQAEQANSNERRCGIHGAFSLRRHRNGVRLLIVDDIITTGATFDESKKMLKDMFGDIVCLAIARTP